MAAATTGRSEGSGWLNFAATMFAVIGCFNLIDGIAAAAKDDLFADEALVVGSLVMWGFLMIVIGALQLYTSYALFKRTDLGNVLGVFLCGISLVAQLFLLPAFPVWGVVIMAVDLVLIYALTVHGYAFG